MIAKVYSATALGFDGKLIEVECDASNGLPNLVIVGLGNKAIEEAKERVRSAIKNTALEFPRKRLTINLAPANLPKHGAHFDLAIAVALLVVSGQIPNRAVQKTMLVGELALDGSLRPIMGVINFAETAMESGVTEIILPEANAHQASLVPGIAIVPARHLKEVFLHLTGQQKLPNFISDCEAKVSRSDHSTSFKDIHGQEHAKRALAIAAAGHHNILFYGPPGAGKTMLAKALVSILPPLSQNEVVEVTKLHSLAGEMCEDIKTNRPFRTPHHSASMISLIGGGQNPRPGEISLAHRGVLFLDELPEYSRATLEALRQPLEDKRIFITRASGVVSFPADFMLVATQNPCPCGYLGDTHHSCSCSTTQIQNYQKKISGPLLDRIDMVVQVSRIDPQTLLAHSSDMTHGHDMTESIATARRSQARRFISHTKTNSTMSSQETREFAKLSPQAKNLLDQAAKALHISARAYFKTIKVARTIADLEQAKDITHMHISEALQYRPRNESAD